MIRKIRVKNFGSFSRVDQDLRKLMVIIGANAAGKSNFLRMFRFLADIANHGLKNAISLQGGPEHLCNLKIGDSQPVSFSVEIDYPYRVVQQDEDRQKLIGIETKEAKYEFEIQFDLTKRTYNVVRDELTLLSTYHRLQLKDKELEAIETIGNFESSFSNNEGILQGRVRDVDVENLDVQVAALGEVPEGELIIEGAGIPLIDLLGEEFLSEISFYDIDPKMSKHGVPVAGLTELDEDGSNLPIALRETLEDEESRDLFNLLLKDLLPIIETIRARPVPDQTVMIETKEKHLDTRSIPAPMLSDGTLRVTAMLLILFFEDKPLVIIEEPERNIHPYLISRLVDMFKDASEKKQILVSTHNPILLKHMDLENILFIYRNNDGFSEAIQPASVDRVRTLLQNEMGLDDLFTKLILDDLLKK